jgi:serine/threonine-protein kinase
MIAGDPRAEERVGSVLHEKWTLERLLGVGGMGAVYAARHRNGARAAVKVLSPSMGRLPHIRKRFLHEGYAANRVEHAGAVRVLDDDVIPDGTDEGTAYLVMELLDGESLSERAKREPSLGERDLLEIADGVLAVLDAAHTNGVVHRDLKPDNLFLARDPERGGTQIKVLDFGLARLLEAREQTIAGMALGTPTYMSPEQAAGHVDQIDGRTDIYALGSILFQLVSNKRIHDAAHTLGLVVRMATMPAPKLRTIAPDVSEAFARIVDHALEFKREDRYPTAAAMRADIQALLATFPAEPSAVNELPPSQPASNPKPVAPAPTIEARKLREQADTVRASMATVAAAPVAIANEGRARTAPPLPSTKKHEPTAPGRRRLGTVLLVAIGGALGFFLWEQRSAIQAGFASSATNPAIASAAPSSSQADMFDGSADTADAEVVVASDGSSLTIAPVDAALDESSDASADAGDEEDDEEDEDLDAAIEASAPASPASATGPRRVSPHPTVKPGPKKKTPRRPGQPRKKKRWHW